MNHSKHVATTIAGVLGTLMVGASAPSAAYTQQEQQAIAAVQGFYDALNARDAAGGESRMPIRPIAEKYLSEKYHQNSPAMAANGQGREGLIRMFQGMGRGAGAGAGATGARPEPAKVYFIGAQGNFVVRVSGRDPSSLQFNMFTVENGKLVEHWDASMDGGMAGGRQGGAPGAPPGASGPPPSSQ